MKETLQLTIPTPCHENWNGMTPQEQGRFCGSCRKMVVDFSMMTDKEIINYISKASEHVCGRFANDQLNKELPIAANKKKVSWIYLWNLLLATLLFTETNAQVKPTKPKKPPVTQAPENVVMGAIAFVPANQMSIAEESAIKGQVYDAVSNEPIQSASIEVWGTTSGTAANALGNFALPVNKKPPVILKVSAVGYKIQTVVASRNNWQNIVVHLLPQADTLAPVQVTGYGSVMGKVAMRYSEIKDTVCTKPDSTARKIVNTVSNWLPALVKKDVKVYPNPVVRGNVIQAALNLQQPGNYKLELLNMAGQVMQVQPVTLLSKQQTIAIPTQSDWSAGIYWIRISAPASNNVYKEKVLIQ